MMDARTAQDMLDKINALNDDNDKIFGHVEKEVSVVRKSFDTLAGPIEGLTNEVDSLKLFINKSIQILDAKLNSSEHRLAVL